MVNFHIHEKDKMKRGEEFFPSFHFIFLMNMEINHLFKGQMVLINTIRKGRRCNELRFN